ncbi:beta-1,3-galactosyl-O-glycosyl-glycoprotein beta-1,6-N-acetylglucosaminyltransferase-like [Haliotis cracherodii]|uniref:beta-1,3-galactosyl-O-glycosyl-glycoprotein beta-1,6-N-acetylglucosaminyltransferase-like n=1 Tax=Haliotis cracherodii TaxID=6455 RepID=UPI0039EC30DB
MTKDEEDFPIAFSMMVYKHIEQVERLLRMVWRPNNVYCIAIDAKTRKEFVEAVLSIAKCFDNVFVHPVQVDVQWGTFSVLEPDVLCMDLLWKQNRKWRYFINLTGQEFPLKTNYELVQILKVYNGANDIKGTFREANMDRWASAGVPPAGLKPRKGAVHIVASRGYVDYVLHNDTAMLLLQWVKKVQIPDEAFFSMLNYNPHLEVPGSYTGDVDDDKRMFLGRYKLWYPQDTCSGRIARNICIMEVRDLSNLVKAPELFVNKFFYDHHPLAYDCLEKWYHNKVDLEKSGNLEFDATLYRNRYITRDHF